MNVSDQVLRDHLDLDPDVRGYAAMGVPLSEDHQKQVVDSLRLKRQDRDLPVKTTAREIYRTLSADGALKKTLQAAQQGTGPGYRIAAEFLARVEAIDPEEGENIAEVTNGQPWKTNDWPALMDEMIVQTADTGWDATTKVQLLKLSEQAGSDQDFYGFGNVRTGDVARAEAL